jgi:hypothetical protein
MGAGLAFRESFEPAHRYTVRTSRATCSTRLARIGARSCQLQARWVSADVHVAYPERPALHVRFCAGSTEVHGCFGVRRRRSPSTVLKHVPLPEYHYMDGTHRRHDVGHHGALSVHSVHVHLLQRPSCPPWDAAPGGGSDAPYRTVYSSNRRGKHVGPMYLNPTRR